MLSSIDSYTLSGYTALSDTFIHFLCVPQHQWPLIEVLMQKVLFQELAVRLISSTPVLTRMGNDSA